jgi:IclR family KDG regulon transcriptional repressor
MGKMNHQRQSAVDRALLLLEAVSKKPSGVTLATLCKEVNIPKTTAHRLLETLTARGYLEFDPVNEKYTIGLKALEVGFSGLSHLEIVDVASPYLQHLADQTGETSFLAVYNEGEIVYLYKVEGTQSIRTTAQLGTRKPIHCTALGKAMLANFSLEEVDRIITEKGLPSFTEHTITDRQHFLEELSRTRTNGYAMDNEEAEMGLTCFAVPLYNYTGQVVGAISIAGPTARQLDNREVFTSQLKEAGMQISRRLGYVPNMRTSVRNL